MTMILTILLFTNLLNGCISFGQDLKLKAKFNLKEESSQGTLVGIIDASKLLSLPANTQFTFKLFTLDKNVESYFQIEKSTGRIILQRRLDREKDEFKEITQLNFQVRIKVNAKEEQQGTAMMEYVAVRVNIIDINDFAPTFPQPKYSMNIPESSAVLRENHILPRAKDRDSELYNIKNYKILADDETMRYFTLYEQQTGGSNPSVIKPYLRQMKPLDREGIAKFRFKLQAIDKGNKIGETDIEIVVTDQNDNYPQFIGLPYSVNVSECTKPGEQIYRLRAEDKDAGVNQEIRFRISELASELISNTFHISSTYNLVLSRPLDYEEMPKRLKIPIVATDGGGLSNSTDVEVWIQDCNDNVVTINVYLEPDSNAGTYTKLKENESKQRLIAVVVTSDRDSGLNGEVSCHLVDISGRSNNNFELVYNRKMIQEHAQVKYFNLYKPENVIFDRETRSRYELKISCNDHGNQRHENSKTIIVDIEDENDEAPKFSRDFVFYIGENNLQGAYVGNVIAVDKDYGRNSRLNYQLFESESKKYFDIDGNGRISALVSFDREERDFYNFTVIASDGGTPTLSSNTSVIVRISDKNDCEPEYNGHRNFFIYESNGTRHVSYTLGKLNATDRDLGENSSLRFSLQPHYGVDPRQMSDSYHLSEDGVLSVRGQLDREKYPIHKLNITISDRGYPIPLKSHVLITVTLRDVNDNRPRIVSDQMIKMITPEMTRGTELLKLRAEDPDEGENKSVTFSLLKSSVSDYFTLSLDGTLMLAKSYDSKKMDSHLMNYRLQIVAKDGGNLTTRAYLRGTFQNIRPPRRGDGGNNGNKGGMHSDDNFAELNQESNLLILLCVAATVVLIFVVVVLVFGYVYLKGETLCFPRRNTTRYSGSYDTAATTKLPRHIATHEEKNSDKACFNSLLPPGKMGCHIANCGDQDCGDMTQSAGDYTAGCQYYKELCHSMDDKLSNKDSLKPSSHSTFTTSLSKSKSQTSDLSSRSTIDHRSHTINNRSILKCDDAYRFNEYGERGYRGLRFVPSDLPVDTTHVYTELETSRINEMDCLGNKNNLKCSNIVNTPSLARQPKITSSFV